MHYYTISYIYIELNLDLFKKTLGPVQKVLEDADLGTVYTTIFVYIYNYMCCLS